MTKASKVKAADKCPDLHNSRTLQALDQAAGGAGDVASEKREQAVSETISAEHGTDDARCEDSTVRDVQRRQLADRVSVRISHASGSEEARERMPTGDRLGTHTGSSEKWTDADIRGEIENRLKADPLLDDAGLFVTVSRGRVIIEGSVENHEAKQRAEAISRQARGTSGHDSNLVVRRPS